MPDSYRVVEVQPEWRHEADNEIEEMGSKEKFWYHSPETDTEWLFKFPQSNNTGQHWAEKIAAEIAARLEIQHAIVELAEYQGSHGSVTESFVRPGQVLVHGNQMLRQVVQGYDFEKTSHQSAHTLSNIWQVMDRVFVKSESTRRAKLRVAEYLVLDALIGNVDRHHENWGFLRRPAGKHWRGFVAPSFDHGSSLARELLDESRDRLLAEDRVDRYVERGHGAIYWSEGGRRGPSPLELVRRGTCKHPDFFRPALMKLEKLDDDNLCGLVNRVPEDWMTPSARKFAIALLRYSFERLGELIR